MRQKKTPSALAADSGDFERRPRSKAHRLKQKQKGQKRMPVET